MQVYFVDPCLKENTTPDHVHLCIHKELVIQAQKTPRLFVCGVQVGPVRASHLRETSYGYESFKKRINTFGCLGLFYPSS